MHSITHYPYPYNIIESITKDREDQDDLIRKLQDSHTELLICDIIRNMVCDMNTPRNSDIFYERMQYNRSIKFISNEYGITERRVSQIIRDIVYKLKCAGAVDRISDKISATIDGKFSYSHGWITLDSNISELFSNENTRAYKNGTADHRYHMAVAKIQCRILRSHPEIRTIRDLMDAGVESIYPRPSPSQRRSVNIIVDMLYHAGFNPNEFCEWSTLLRYYLDKAKPLTITYNLYPIDTGVAKLGFQIESLNKNAEFGKEMLDKASGIIQDAFELVPIMEWHKVISQELTAIAKEEEADWEDKGEGE